MQHPTLFSITFIALSLGSAVACGTVPPGTAPGHPVVYASAWLAAGCWCVGVVRRPGWWAAGCGFAWLHTALAFHCAHGWSHAAAFAEVERVGGTGYGVHVNYLFLAVWAADAAWLSVRPTSYWNRPRWLTWVAVGFLGFIVFQGTVVFGGWAARAVFGPAFAWLGWRRLSARGL